MPKYGQAKYGTFKYGEYTGVPGSVSPDTTYRISANRGALIVNDTAEIGTRVDRIRMKADSGQWAECMSTEIDANPRYVRIKAVGDAESPWVVATTILLSEGS